MPMYNPLQYSQNYSMTSRSFWSYYRDKTDDVDDVSDGKSFNYKTKIVENKPKGPGNEGHANRPPVLTLNAEVTIPLKYFSNFWRSFDFSLINYEIGLDLSWTKDCLVIEQNSTKTFVPVVTLSINGNIKFLENIKQEFKRTISWSKYKSEITTQTKNNNLNYLIDPTLRNINRLFFHLKMVTIILRDYTPFVETKDF